MVPAPPSRLIGPWTEDERDGITYLRQVASWVWVCPRANLSIPLCLSDVTDGVEPTAAGVRQGCRELLSRELLSGRMWTLRKHHHVGAGPVCKAVIFSAALQRRSQATWWFFFTACILMSVTAHSIQDWSFL